MIDHEKVAQAHGSGLLISDQAIDRLNQFVTLVLKWNPTINVIAKSTVTDIWNRHILDSIQVIRCARPEQRLWLDLGSGGGFPGVVVAILAAELFPDLRFTLVESDKRKSVFLTQAARQLALSFTVLSGRIEEIDPQYADVVSARALAPLQELCGLAKRHLSAQGVCAFLKGANADAEIDQAAKNWSFDLERSDSITDPRSSVLFLRGLEHV